MHSNGLNVSDCVSKWKERCISSAYWLICYWLRNIRSEAISIPNTATQTKWNNPVREVLSRGRNKHWESEAAAGVKRRQQSACHDCQTPRAGTLSWRSDRQRAVTTPSSSLRTQDTASTPGPPPPSCSVRPTSGSDASRVQPGDQHTHKSRLVQEAADLADERTRQPMWYVALESSHKEIPRHWGNSSNRSKGSLTAAQ